MKYLFQALSRSVKLLIFSPPMTTSSRTTESRLNCRKGGKKERLVDIADVQYDYAFDGSLFNSKKSGTPIICIRNIPESQTEDYITEAADFQYLVYNGDIVVGMDREFHINSWAGDTTYLVQRTCRIKPLNSDLNGFLLWAIYEPIKYFERTVVGATVVHLGKNT